MRECNTSPNEASCEVRLLPAGPEEHHHATLRRQVTAPYEVGIELPFDLHRDLITLQQGAELAGVSRATIEKWIKRGYRDPKTREKRLLTNHGVDGAPRVTGIEVLRAEAATRARSGRRPFPHQRRSDM